MNRFFGAPSLADIPLQASLKAKVVIGMHKHRVRVDLSQLLIVERQDPLHDDDINGLYPVNLRGIAAVHREVIYRSIYPISIEKLIEVISEEGNIKRVRMIVIAQLSLLGREFHLVSIVRIEGDNLNPFRTTESMKVMRQRCLPTCGSTCDSDNSATSHTYELSNFSERHLAAPPALINSLSGTG